MKRIQNLLFGALVLSTLGFGAASAAAQPGEARAEKICPFLRTAEECATCCSGHGYTSYLFELRDCSCF